MYSTNATASTRSFTLDSWPAAASLCGVSIAPEQPHDRALGLFDDPRDCRTAIMSATRLPSCASEVTIAAVMSCS